MSFSDYSIEIISHHPEFKNKPLRKYGVEGIETIGAFGDEPFEIRFNNCTAKGVQVKLSLDGTDILTGKPADTTVTNDMWFVAAFSTLKLKAWPENSSGGAQFIFTSAEKSVALHTHGDMSHRGIIAAAVFVEGHVEPVRLNPVKEVHHHHYNNNYGRRDFLGRDFTTCNDDTKGANSSFYERGITETSGQSFDFNGPSAASAAGETTYSADASTSSTSSTMNYGSVRRSKSSAIKELQSSASVGAGQFVNQKITYVTGLIKPVLTTTVRVKYIWWDNLVEALKANNFPEAHPSGFPGDKPIMSLGSTPRIGENVKSTIQVSNPVYSRV